MKDRANRGREKRGFLSGLAPPRQAEPGFPWAGAGHPGPFCDSAATPACRDCGRGPPSSHRQPPVVISPEGERNSHSGIV